MNKSSTMRNVLKIIPTVKVSSREKRLRNTKIYNAEESFRPTFPEKILPSSMSEKQIMNKISQNKNIKSKAPILSLIVLSSPYYKSGKHFRIGPFGLIDHKKNEDDNNSKRNSINNNHPGIVYFGYVPENINNNKINGNNIEITINEEKDDNNIINNSKLNIETKKEIKSTRVNKSKANMHKMNKSIKSQRSKLKINAGEVNTKNNSNTKILNTAPKINTIPNSNNNILTEQKHYDSVDIQVPPGEKNKNSNNNNSNNSTEIIENNKNIGRYFYIYYNPDYSKYYVKDIGSPCGTFIKIENEIILKNSYVINIGDTFLEISIGLDGLSFYNSNTEMDIKNQITTSVDSNAEYNNNLNLKIISKDKVYDPVNFLPTKSIIKIGRATSCEVSIDDILLSRVHCTIEYKNTVGWIIRDGYRSEDSQESDDIKWSTNGTWLHAFEDTPIYEGMILRSDNHLFRCKFS